MTQYFLVLETYGGTKQLVVRTGMSRGEADALLSTIGAGGWRNAFVGSLPLY